MCVRLIESLVMQFLLPSGLPGGGASGSYQGQKKNEYIAITYSSPSGLPRSEVAFHHALARSKKTLSCLPPLLSIFHPIADMPISSIGP